MNILTRLFGSRTERPAAPPPASVIASSSHGHHAPPGTTVTRKELLRVVLRDTLTRHGIPAAWIEAEVLTTTSRAGAQGLHWRLQLKHWDSRLMVHSVALQNGLIKRLMSFDPLASTWLNGISWQYALADESACPALPAPRTWTAEPRIEPAPKETAATRAAAAAAADADARASLQELFAARDEDFRRHAKGGDGEATQPMWLGTEPAKL
jgi:hypothetical protein